MRRTRIAIKHLGKSIKRDLQVEKAIVFHDILLCAENWTYQKLLWKYLESIVSKGDVKLNDMVNKQRMSQKDIDEFYRRTACTNKKYEILRTNTIKWN